MGATLGGRHQLPGPRTPEALLALDPPRRSERGTELCRKELGLLFWGKPSRGFTSNRSIDLKPFAAR